MCYAREMTLCRARQARGFTHLRLCRQAPEWLISRYSSGFPRRRRRKYAGFAAPPLETARSAWCSGRSVGVSPTLAAPGDDCHRPLSGFHPPSAALRGFTHPRAGSCSGFHPLNSASHRRGFTHLAAHRGRADESNPAFGVSPTLGPVDSVGGTATSASGDHPPQVRGNSHRVTGDHPPRQFVDA